MATGEAQIARSQDRGVARKHAFLEAAREVFLEQGYEGASVNEVVRRAGGSLATLYAQFGNKEGLFQAVLFDQHDRFTHDITPPESALDQPIERGLQTIGEHLVRALLAAQHLAFYRLIIGEGRKFPPQLRHYIATGGAERVRGVIANVLRRHRVGGDDPDLGAAQLFELWRSRHHYAALSDPAYQVTDTEIAAHVADGVNVFLNGAPRA